MSGESTELRSDLSARLAVLALQCFVPTIRNAVAADSTFGEGLDGFSTQVTLGDDGPTFDANLLFERIAHCLIDSAGAEILDSDHKVWNLQRTSTETGTIALTVEGRRLLLPDYSLASPLQVDRDRAIRHQERPGGLDSASLAFWRSVGATRPLSKEELEKFLEDVQDTPAFIQEAVETSLRRGQVTIEELVPAKKRYFERLVGAYDCSAEFSTYAGGCLKQFADDLVARSTVEGLWQALLLCSHTAIANQLPAVPEDDLLKVLERAAEETADTISKVGAIQIGTPAIDRVPGVGVLIDKLSDQVLGDDPTLSGGRFSLLSSLFILVDGQLSRTRVLGEHPPYYRRLAALSQASLIERALRSVQVDLEALGEWARRQRIMEFYAQSLVDLRAEPRWLADYALPNQLWNEMLGRLLGTARVHEEAIKSAGATNLEVHTLEGLAIFPAPYLAGPLEGGVESENPLPPKIAGDIEERMLADSLDPQSFVSLVNSVLVFRLEQRHVELAAQAIRNAKHMVGSADHPTGLSHVLIGLARVAAATRSSELALELVLLSRRARRAAGLVQSVDESFALGLTAAAAHNDLDRWATYIGDWVTELAFDLTTEQDAKKAIMYLKSLTSASPRLRPLCNRALAALMTVTAT